MQVREAEVDYELLTRRSDRSNRKERIEIKASTWTTGLRSGGQQRNLLKDALNIAQMLGIDREIIEQEGNIWRIQKMKSKLEFLDPKIIESARIMRAARALLPIMQKFIDKAYPLSAQRGPR